MSRDGRDTDPPGPVAVREHQPFGGLTHPLVPGVLDASGPTTERFPMRLRHALPLIAAPALLGLAAVPAGAVPAPAGHTDIVELECSSVGGQASYELGSHLGTTHVEPADIGGFEFVFPAASASTTFDGSGWVIDAEADAGVPDIGLTYEVAPGAESVCADGVDIAISGATFNGATSVALSQANDHVHGTWRLAAPSATAINRSLSFTVSTDDSAFSGVISPVKFVVGS